VVGNGVGGTAPRNYATYLDRCPDPLAADDDVVSPAIFFVLAERISESDVSPIPLVLEYPDGTDDPAWFGASGQRGTVVGFGSGEPGLTSLGTQQGIRRVKDDVTPLRVFPPYTDASDPTTLHPRAWRLTHDGGMFQVQSWLQGNNDTGSGPTHVDFAAP